MYGKNESNNFCFSLILSRVYVRSRYHFHYPSIPSRHESLTGHQTDHVRSQSLFFLQRKPVILEIIHILHIEQCARFFLCGYTKLVELHRNRFGASERRIHSSEELIYQSILSVCELGWFDLVCYSFDVFICAASSSSSSTTINTTHHTNNDSWPSALIYYIYILW